MTAPSISWKKTGSTSFGWSGSRRAGRAARTLPGGYGQGQLSVDDTGQIAIATITEATTSSPRQSVVTLFDSFDAAPRTVVSTPFSQADTQQGDIFQFVDVALSDNGDLALIGRRDQGADSDSPVGAPSDRVILHLPGADYSQAQTLAEQPNSGPGLVGIDAEGRVSFTDGSDGVIVYDPATGTSQLFAPPADFTLCCGAASATERCTSGRDQRRDAPVRHVGNRPGGS